MTQDSGALYMFMMRDGDFKFESEISIAVMSLIGIGIGATLGEVIFRLLTYMAVRGKVS